MKFVNIRLLIVFIGLLTFHSRSFFQILVLGIVIPLQLPAFF